MTRGARLREIHKIQEEYLARHVAELSNADPQFNAAKPIPEVIEAACRPGLRLSQLFETLVEGYADRPAIGQRARQLSTDAATGRTCVRLLPRFETLTYREIWDRVRAIAAGWRNDAVSPVAAGDVIATVGFSSADYLVIEMACAYLGLVAVPLHHNAPTQCLRPIIEECEPRVVAVSAEYLDLAVESVLTSSSLRQLMVFDYQPEVDEHRVKFEHARARLQEEGRPIAVTTVDEIVERGSQSSTEPVYTEGSDERLAMILYTSGSTGAPKGAMYTERAVVKAWTMGFYLPPGLPVFNVNFMPLNHLGGRVPLASAFIAGGTSYFVPKSDLSTLFEDWALVRPTEMGLVPRVVEMLFHEYRRAVDRRVTEGADSADAQKVAAAELRGRLGGRVLGGFVGTAPLAAEMKVFLDSVLNVHIADGYGLTEAGLVSKDGVIVRTRVIDYKLVDVPELGYFLTDRPYPRGELLVKTDMMMPGYYKRPELSAQVFDKDGFYKTGDVMAEIEPDRLDYIDRRNNVLKLAQGEFVVLAHLEAIYCAAPLVRQVFLYGNSERSSLLGVIVPAKEALAEYGNTPALKAALHESLQQTAAGAMLHPYEVPVDFLIETDAFTDENGLLSGLGKLLRLQLKERYGQRLEQMYSEIAAAHAEEMRALRETAADRPVVETLTLAVRAMLGTSGVKPEARFTDLGGDSLSALTFSNLLKEIFAVEVPARVILSPTGSIQSIANHVETQQNSGVEHLDRPTFTTVHRPGTTVISASELTLSKFINSETVASARTLPRAAGNPRTVLLTGANGWLGRFLALEWLERLSQQGGKLIAIVRGRNPKEARARLEKVFDSDDPELLNRFHELAATHLEVLAGDIGEQYLGLDAAAWSRLARGVDAIVHAAALVNHALPYDQLFGPNVAGTAELIRLAITTRVKPVKYVSTIAVTATIPQTRLEEDGDIRRMSPARPINDEYANGYANSKWAGEVLLREANERCGLPVSVFRSGMILTHTRYRGQLNVPDLFTRLIFSILVTGIAPQSFYERGDIGSRARPHYDGLPVDFVAEVIATIGARTSEGYRSFDVINPHDDNVSLDVFVDWLIDAGHTIQRIGDYDDWLTRFRAALTALPESQRRHSVLPLLSALGRPYPSIHVATVPTEAFHAELSTAKVDSSQGIPHVTAGLINKYVSDLRHLGLLRRPQTVPGIGNASDNNELRRKTA